MQRTVSPALQVQLQQAGDLITALLDPDAADHALICDATDLLDAADGDSDLQTGLRRMVNDIKARGGPPLKRARPESSSEEDEEEDEDDSDSGADMVCNSKGTVLPRKHRWTKGKLVGLCRLCRQPLDLSKRDSCFCGPEYPGESEATGGSVNANGLGVPFPCRKCGQDYSTAGCGCESDGSLDDSS